MFAHKWLLAAFIAASLATTSAHADNSGRTTYFTFNRPVALPGVELAPGEYIFELPLPDSQLNLVRVLSRDRRTVYLTAFTSIVQRPGHVAPAHQLTYHESPAGASPAIKTWFPENDNDGRQFIYR